MYVLAIDTATNSGGAALSRNGEVVGSVMLKTPLRYSDQMIGMVDFLIRAHQLRLKDVGCLVAATGPGSFTGVRIGLAVVKAMGQALATPAVGISTLEALAWRFHDIQTRVAPMLDARRQQIYGAAFEIEGWELKSVASQTVAHPAEWLKRLPPGDFLFVGDGARLYQGAISAARPGSRVLESDNQILEPLCRLGFRRLCAGLAESVESLSANYVRPSDAELAAGSEAT